MQTEGIFIVIEGIQGAKEQLELLKNHIRKLGHDVVVFNFPQYKKQSSFFIEQYLQGNYGATDAYTASLFYALDRFEAANSIRSALESNKVVLATNYTASTMAKQGVLFNHPEERRGFFIWLDNLESQMLKIPRPNQTFVLRPQIDQYTKQQTEVYDDLTQLFPKDFQRIDTVRSEQKIDSKTLHKMIWQKVEPRLPVIEKPTRPERTEHQETPSKHIAAVSLRAQQILTNARVSLHKVASDETSYYTPKDLPAKLKEAYRNFMEHVIATSDTMSSQLTEAKITDTAAVNLVLPLAVQQTFELDKSHMSKNTIPASQYIPEITAITDNTDQQLKHSTRKARDMHSTDFEQLRLSNVTPRNELELVIDILYETSNLSRDEIIADAEKLTYEKREKILTSYLSSSFDYALLHNASYTIDILCSFSVLQELQKAVNGGFIVQPISPRFGYAMPDVIDNNGLSEKYEECFDKSLELFSKLQSAGFEADAPYVVLSGHKVRCSRVFSVYDLKQLAKFKGSKEYHEVYKKIQEKISEVHPLISEYV